MEHRVVLGDCIEITWDVAAEEEEEEWPSLKSFCWNQPRHQCSWCLGPSHVFFCAFFAWPLDNTPPTLTTLQWCNVDVDPVIEYNNCTDDLWKKNRHSKYWKPPHSYHIVPILARKSSFQYRYLEGFKWPVLQNLSLIYILMKIYEKKFTTFSIGILWTATIWQK